MRKFCLVLSLLTAACGGPASRDEAIDAVRGEVLDSPSARFAGVRACPSGNGYYGLVDSKDTDGRYQGLRRFIFADGEVGLQDNATQYADVRAACVRAGR